jgi:hypothetical protein
MASQNSTSIHEKFGITGDDADIYDSIPGGRMFAVKGFYDGETITLKELIPVKEKYEVIITFLNPVVREKQAKQDKKRILDSLVGIAAHNKMTLDEIKTERLAKQ